MSEPSTIEFAKIGVRDVGATTPFVFICGIQTTGFNRTVNTNDRAVKDCDKPGRPAERRVRVISRARTLTGSGLYNYLQRELIDDLEGVRKEFQVLYYDLDDGTEEGEVVEVRQGPGVATSINTGTTEDGDGSIEITIESDGAWTSIDGADYVPPVTP